MNTSLNRRRSLLSTAMSAAVVVALLPVQALAYDTKSTSDVDVDAKGVALRGNDPVTYFTTGKPGKGVARIAATHRGATYHFESVANRDAFMAHADKYAPQFGGFCAMGVVLNKKLDGDPDVWRVVDNKLYLNVTRDVQKKWLEDVPGNVVKAEQKWPLIRNKAPKDL